MSAQAVIVIVIVLVVVAALAAFLLRPAMRRRRLQQKFGPEYEHVVEETGSRREAERELADRERRFSELDIRPLAQEQRERYSVDWRRVQERFVDDPVDAVGEAQRLVTALMAERGYPTEGYEERIAHLSVRHAGVLDHYRTADEYSRRAADGKASTEDLRKAMVNYRELFADLLEERGTVPQE
jgi:hypothetical protein